MHKTLINWRAKRAGGRITVYGEDQDNNRKEVKVTNVDSIVPGVGCCVATDKAGTTHHLMLR